MGMDLHDEVATRLALQEQRYTSGRRVIVDVLVDAGRPLAIPDVLARAAGLSQSSAYRNLTVLAEAGALRRVTGVGDRVLFELAEDLIGHHHHAVCTTCGTVLDVHGAPRLERALAAAAEAAGQELGFVVEGHSIDLLGTCRDC